jgi:hypothetical protein
MLRFACRMLGLVALCAAAFAAPAGEPAAFAPAAPEVSLQAKYLATGESTPGMVRVALATRAPAGAKLLVTAWWDVEVSADEKATARRTEKLAEVDLSGKEGSVEQPFEVKAAGLLIGTVRVKAEVLTGDAAEPLAYGWSKPLPVGVRRRIDLAGEWPVTAVEPFQFEDKWRPKDWKMPQDVKTLTLPGTFDPVLTTWFRGWVTVKREVEWKAAGDLKPRFLRVSDVWDSVLATVEGAKVGEVMPVEELDCLTHWMEFHSQFKGEENRAKRLMMADHDEYPSLTMPLTKALPTEGKATIELKLRGTSGLFRPKPAYGIHGELHLELAPAVCIKSVSFDTEKPGEKRRVKFALGMLNESGKGFRGKLRTVYGQYAGPRSYEGACPAYAADEQPLVLPAGESAVEVLRDETPRFATCRATFLVLDANGNLLDGETQEFHTVTVEIRDAREIYLNNERFITKGRGSASDDPNKRWQLRVNGVNAIRGPTNPDHIEELLANGLLTSAGGALLASCERCTFWNPQDTGNITRSVKGIVRVLARYPGIIEWEATNELFGEPEECRVAIQEAFHKLDPYHRPVLATKGSGEWEAEAKNGRVPGVDIVGVQYLLSKEAVESVTSSITEQPLICSEVNWNDGTLMGQNMWPFWLERGLSGALLFDYSGNSTDQGVPLVAPPDNDKNWWTIKQSNRELYQDLVSSVARGEDGRLVVTAGNRMPYTLRDVSVKVRGLTTLRLPDLKPGDAADISLPANALPTGSENVVMLAEYRTHGGLPHVALLTPPVPKPTEKGGRR